MLRKFKALTLLNEFSEKGYLDKKSTEEIFRDIEVYLDEEKENKYLLLLRKKLA